VVGASRAVTDAWQRERPLPTVRTSPTGTSTSAFKQGKRPYGLLVYRAAGLPKSRKPADRHASGSTSLAEGVNQRLRASMTGPVRQQLDRYGISAAG